MYVGSVGNDCTYCAACATGGFWMAERLTLVAARARLRDVHKRYERGETLVAIGKIWGLTKQRVAKLVQQPLDRAGKDGRPKKEGVERWPSGGIKYPK